MERFDVLIKLIDKLNQCSTAGFARLEIELWECLAAGGIQRHRIFCGWGDVLGWLSVFHWPVRVNAAQYSGFATPCLSRRNLIIAICAVRKASGFACPFARLSKKAVMRAAV